MHRFALLETDSERFDCIFQKPNDVGVYGHNWPEFIAYYDYDVMYMDYALKIGCKIRPISDILYEIATYNRGYNRDNNLKRLIDAGYDYKPKHFCIIKKNNPKLVSAIYCTVQFRRLSRRLAIITIGAHRCKSQLNKPGFIDICKIIARLVWSARFRGSEWE